MKELSVKSCISFGWSTFKAHARFFIGVSAILFLGSIIANIPESLTDNGQSFSSLHLVGSLIAVALSFLVSMGKVNFYLRAHDTDLQVKNLWNPKRYLSFVAATIITAVLTLLGLILFIVPGLIIGVSFCFTTYLVVDRGMGPIAAMKESIRLTKGNRWNLLLLGVVILGINLLGVLAVLVGLLVTLPVTTLALVHAYRTLAGTAPMAAMPIEDMEPATPEEREAALPAEEA